MRKFILQVLVVVVAIFAITWFVYYLFREEKKKHELVLYGNVDVRLVDIGFRVPGRVDQLMFEEGDVVRTGDLIAVLDKTPYDSQVQQADANAKAVEVNLNNAEILLRRRQELIGVGGVSQEDLDNALANRDQLAASWNQQLSALQVQIDDLAYTEVYAPTDGTILTRIREPGTVVNAGDPVFTLSVASPVWIRAYVEEPDLGKIAYGMEAKIETDSGSVYTGRIGFISPMAEFTPKTVQSTQLRTDLVYRLRIYADNPDWGLKQGMPVTVKLSLKNHKP